MPTSTLKPLRSNRIARHLFCKLPRDRLSNLAGGRCSVERFFQHRIALKARTQPFNSWQRTSQIKTFILEISFDVLLTALASVALVCVSKLLVKSLIGDAPPIMLAGLLCFGLGT